MKLELPDKTNTISEISLMHYPKRDFETGKYECVLQHKGWCISEYKNITFKHEDVAVI